MCLKRLITAKFRSSDLLGPPWEKAVWSKFKVNTCTRLLEEEEEEKEGEGDGEGGRGGGGEVCHCSNIFVCRHTRRPCVSKRAYSYRIQEFTFVKAQWACRPHPYMESINSLINRCHALSDASVEPTFGCLYQRGFLPYFTSTECVQLEQQAAEMRSSLQVVKEVFDGT